MNKAYLFAPLLGCVAFFAVYWNFTSDYKKKEADKVEKVRVEREEKLKKEAELRKKAIEDAVVSMEKRKKEREEKETKDRNEKEARQNAVDARDKAGRDQQKLSQQVERLKKELTAEKEAVEKIEKDKTGYLAEQAFLRDYVKKAEENVKSLEAVLKKIADADAQREKEAAAAAAAAKK